ncbi:MAG: DNA primase [Armatimonadetes bacterium]|nr:DNA primase [Armatimonadota bacterium]
MALTPVDRDSLRERLDVLDVLGGYMRLQRAGNEWRGLCPFHDEKTPSFYVNPAKGLWICRGQCGTGGDVFDFVMRAERLDFRDAAEFLANRIGCTMVVNQGEARRSEERERIFDINGLATRLYERALWQTDTGRVAREYLLRRGLTEETIRHFRLGYAPDGWDHLARHLERQNLSLADAELAGLVRSRERSGGHYDRFRHRIMFPILDSQDRTLGFGGRVLRHDDEPKYLNTTETPVFHKGTVLYGLPFAVGSLADGAIVVEGYMDVIALHQHGINAAMATLGTALTSDHLRLLRRHTERVILCYDADTAGQRATDRAAVLFIEEGIEGRVLTLPPGQDPDEFVGEQGRDAFYERLRTAPDLITHRLLTALDAAGDDPLSRAGAIQEAVIPILADIREPLRQTFTLRQVVDWWSSQSVGLAEEFERSLVQAVRGYRRQAARRGSRRDAPREPVAEQRWLPREQQVEREVLAAMLSHANLLAVAREQLGEPLFGDAPCRALFAAIMAHGADPTRLAGALDETGRALLADLSCRPPGEESEIAKTFDRQVLELRANALQTQAEALRRERARVANDDFEAQTELLKRIHVLERELDEARRRLLG